MKTSQAILLTMLMFTFGKNVYADSQYSSTSYALDQSIKNRLSSRWKDPIEKDSPEEDTPHISKVSLSGSVLMLTPYSGEFLTKNFSPGYRLTTGLNLNTHWNANIKFCTYQNDSSVPLNQMINESEIHPDLIDAKFTTAFQFHDIEGVITRQISLKNDLTISPFCGIELAQTKRHVNYYIDNEPLFKTHHATGIRGIGPEAGVSLQKNFSSHVGILGSVTQAFLHSQTKFGEAAIQQWTPLSKCKIASVINIGDEGYQFLQVIAGYEMIYWGNETITENSNLGMHGVSVQLTLNF